MIDTQHASFGFDFFRLEPRDASRLLEDPTPVLGRRLEQSIHFALLNQAVRIYANACTSEKIFDILEAARLAVDSVLAVSAAKNASTDLNLIRVVPEDARGIIQYQSHLGAVGRFASALGRSFEDDVGHIGTA